ncbi:MAG: hypothetical protein IKK39_04730 [Thermoguttaceae bacterium]|nr:hypothetical protein [Thermoguttaceae bacterium]
MKRYCRENPVFLALFRLKTLLKRALIALPTKKTPLDFASSGVFYVKLKRF